jgi:hypothetical protein
MAHNANFAGCKDYGRAFLYPTRNMQLAETRIPGTIETPFCLFAPLSIHFAPSLRSRHSETMLDAVRHLQ